MFGKQQQPAEQVRRNYNPYVPEDKEKILEFEKILALYNYDFDAYAKTGLVVNYGAYGKLGAISRMMAQDYHDAKLKFYGLQQLRYMQEQAREEDAARIKSLVQ